MNVLFTTPALPPKTPFISPEKRPPLGLGTLLSLVRNDGHKTYFIDNYLERSNFIEEGFLQRNRVDYIAISVNNACWKHALEMLVKIENLRKTGVWKGKIIIGGPFSSVSLEKIPGFVDYIVQGEGEKAILDIINSDDVGRIVKTERRRDLDSLPFQPWDIFSKLPYDYTCPFMNCEKVFTMNTSRGCPCGCTFCSVSSIWNSDYTYQGAERIISEIEHLANNYGAKGIYFREDNFALNHKRTVEFCELMSKKKVDVLWACEARVDTLCDGDLVELMSNAGCRGIYLGVESGSQRILDYLNKNITVDQIETAVKLCKKNSIRTYCSLMIGLPSETYRDFLLTKKLMKKLKPYSYCYNVFVGIPYSPLYKYMLENNLYEYQDIDGLVYPIGYDVKMNFFSGIDSKNLVDYQFKERTAFDQKLLQILKKKSSIRRILEYFRL